MFKWNSFIAFGIGILIFTPNIFSQDRDICNQTNRLFEVLLYNQKRFAYFDLDSLKQVFPAQRPQFTYNKCSGFKSTFDHPGAWFHQDGYDPKLFNEKDWQGIYLLGYVLSSTGEDTVGWITQKGEVMTYTEFNTGKQWDCTVKGTEEAGVYPAIAKDSLIIIAYYHPCCNGGGVACYDLKAQKLRWQFNQVKVSTSHSRYVNNTFISLYGNRVILYSNEDLVISLDIFDLYSGKRWLHYLTYQKTNPNSHEYEWPEEFE
jgi:hypothetical protein